MTITYRIDDAEYRRVLGHFPTGVTVVAAAGVDGPAGMAVSSFSSVSLDPPLVGFYVGQTSRSWTQIEAAGAFCVNVLAADQEEVSRRFASRDGDRFAGLGWEPLPSGAPRIEGVLAWIECQLHSVSPAGDHHAVLGEVVSLGTATAKEPLLYYRGGYGRLTA